MNKTTVGIVVIVYALAVMTLVSRRYGSGMISDQKSSFGEVLWLATLWGVLGSTAMYLNPTTQFWSPQIPTTHKILFWLIGFLFAVTLLRTFVIVRPVGRKLLTAVLGLILFFLMVIILGLREEPTEKKLNTAHAGERPDQHQAVTKPKI